MNKDIWWTSLEEPGLEHLRVSQNDAHIIAESVVLKLEGGKPFELSYRILTDSNWRVREVELKLSAASKAQRIEIFADGAGNWKDADGNELPEFAGCFEIDISATPLTNTLPIKRTDLKIGESVNISVVYFLIPEMQVERSEQRYTRLETDVYKFEENGLFAGFTADLRFDSNGFLVDYPDLFGRINS
jgi:hypothetical protein